MKEQLDNIEKTLARIDVKLTDHLDRLSKAESNIDWLKGSVKISLTLLITATTSLAGWFFKTLG